MIDGRHKAEMSSSSEIKEEDQEDEDASQMIQDGNLEHNKDQLDDI